MRHLKKLTALIPALGVVLWCSPAAHATAQTYYEETVEKSTNTAAIITALVVVVLMFAAMAVAVRMGRSGMLRVSWAVLAIIFSGTAMLFTIIGSSVGALYSKAEGDPADTVRKFYDAIVIGDYPTAYSCLSDYTGLGLETEPGTENAALVYDALKASYEYTLVGEAKRDRLNATQTVRVKYLDLASLEASVQDGVQTLTLPLLCAKWNFPIENYAFTVTLPEAFPATPGFASGYQGDVIEDYMTTSVQENVLSGSTTVSLKDHEALTMTLEAPDGFFSGKHAAWSAGSATTVLIFVCAALGLLYWLLKLRSPRLSHALRTLPPDSAQPGDLPYLLCGRGADFNAMVLHWASLGYLTISVSAEGHVLLHRRVDMGNERRRYEVKLMNMLFGESDVCDSASSRYKRAAAAAKGVVPRFWQRRLYRRDSGNPVILIALSCLACALALLASVSLLLPDGGWRWLALVLSLPLGGVLARLVHRTFSAAYLGRKIELGAGILAGVLLLLVGRLSGATLPMVVALLLAVFTGWQTVHGGRRSDLGTMLISQTIGFRRFLTRMSDHRVQVQLQNAHRGLLLIRGQHGPLRRLPQQRFPVKGAALPGGGPALPDEGGQQLRLLRQSQRPEIQPRLHAVEPLESLHALVQRLKMVVIVPVEHAERPVFIFHLGHGGVVAVR